MFIDTVSSPNEPELSKLEFTILVSSVYELDAVSKLVLRSAHGFYQQTMKTYLNGSVAEAK